MEAGPLTVRIVTDSSSCLPPGWAEEHGVTVIPQGVVADGRAYRENVDLSGDDFYRLLEQGAVATSSQPRPEDFRAAYTGSAGAGRALGGPTDEIVAIHIGSRLSGTLDAAAAHAEEFAPGRVWLVDSGSAGLGLGFLVMEAARLAELGLEAADIAHRVQDMATRTHVFFMLHTMAYLVRGGRVGRAAGLAAALLRLRPILTFEGGQIVPAGRTRTPRQAAARLRTLVDETAAAGVSHAGFHFGLNREEVEGWRSGFVERYGVEPYTTQLGPAVGAHSGPRIVGIVLVNRA